VFAGRVPRQSRSRCAIVRGRDRVQTALGRDEIVAEQETTVQPGTARRRRRRLSDACREGDGSTDGRMIDRATGDAHGRRAVS